MKPIDITGNKYGRLTVLSYAGSGKWLCRCECGNECTVRGWNLKSGSTVSCGCKNKENIHAARRNIKDITGKRYGDLEVIRYIRSDESGAVYECKCHACGRTIELCSDLIKQYTSCGCKARKSGKENVSQLHAEIREIKTNAGNVMRKDANANSKTGIRGVCYLKNQGYYVAYITYQGIRYKLKQSKDIDECINARKLAECQIRGDFKKWYEQYKKYKNCEQ